MPIDPDDSPFSARMKEIDDAAPATGLPTVLISWGLLLAACIVVGAIAFAAGPYFMEDYDNPNWSRGQINQHFMKEETKGYALFRLGLGGGAGALLGLGAIVLCGREDLKEAWRAR